jgi:hypothetical protein
LTDAVLADGPPDRRHSLSALATAGALALVLVALVGLHYWWSQGRSYLSRYLDATGASAAREPCEPMPWDQRGVASRPPCR